MINNFSPNMLKTYQTCPKKFYYKYIENINVPQSSTPFEKGKKIHALANYCMQGINIDRIKTALNKEEQKVWNLLLKNSYFNKDKFKSEFTLTCRLSDIWIGGRLDAIVQDFDKFYILDYKTGSAPKNAKYDYQTMIYLLCADKYLKDYGALSFVYIDLKNDKNEIIELNQNLKTEYESKIISACKKINSDTIYQCNTEECARCEYKKFCN
ncbi:PD-(D/E)XK nuclease family protein [bacterium]|nr:PD-(D/E)XK nuclease family protein [bacterium]